MFTISDLSVVVKRGDLTKESADAICNPANSLMFMGGGVAWALKLAGGEVTEREAPDSRSLKEIVLCDLSEGMVNAWSSLMGR